MIRAYIFLFLIVVNAACSEEEETVSYPEEVSASANTPISNASISGKTFSYLALGDSYTIGQGIDEADNWPNQLKGQLLSRTVNLNPVKIIAKTGWTTDSLLKAIEEQNPNQFDLVSLMIGVNNQFQNISFSQFETEFEVLLSTAIDLAGSEERVFVLSIPDYSVTKYSTSNPVKIAREINEYNRYIEQRCNDRKVKFIDITVISRSLGQASNALADDGLHPSKTQYTKWVNNMIADVINLLANRPS